MNRRQSLYFGSLVGFLLLMILVTGGSIGNPSGTQSWLLGRWQRVSEAGPGGAMEISWEYIEFRENNLLLNLTEVSGDFRLVNTVAYSVLAPDQLQVTGSCFRSWERFSCTKNFHIAFDNERMIISDETDPAWQGEYVYIGDPHLNLPPTVIPPFASPTP